MSRSATRSLPLLFFPALSGLASLARANHGPGCAGGCCCAISGDTLGRDRWSFALRTDLTLFDNASLAEAGAIASAQGDFDGLDRAWLSTLTASWGLRDDFQLSASLGVYSADGFVSAEDNGGTVETDSGDFLGLGDLWLDAKWRVHQDARGSLSLLAGLKLPIGETEAELDGGGVPHPSDQPSSGAFDARLGIAGTHPFGERWQIDGSVLYTARTEDADFQVGNRLDVGVALGWRPASVERSTLTLGLLGSLLSKDQEDGMDMQDSGGDTLYLAPGLRTLFGERWALTCSAAFPLVQDLNGEQIEADAKFSVSLDWLL